MVIYEGTGKRNEVAISFDDGPNPEITPKILKVLKDKNVRATFFLIGKRAEEYPELVKQIVRESHDIGSHTYTHATKDTLNKDGHEGKEAILREIQQGTAALKRIAGLADNEIRFLRPPGLYWPAEFQEIAEPFYGHRVIMSGTCGADYAWDEANHQWDENNIEAIDARVNVILGTLQRELKPGSIIALHDSAEYGIEGHENYPNWKNRAIPTLKTLPKIIDITESRGFSIVKLSQMDLIEENLRTSD
jgi:peptidoglycan/xylan/chitin deacetylase (PgdA/CDA1 family)